MKPITLVEANMNRAIAIAAILAPRILKPWPGKKPEQKGYEDNPWRGYKPEEGLVGHYTSYNTLTYERPSNRHAKLVMGFLSMKDIKQKEISDSIVLSENIIEKYVDEYHFKKAIKYSETIEHTFSKTVSFSEAAKQAWEVAAKVAFSAEYAGIKGSVEASAKYGQELSQSRSESETQTDKVSKTIEIQGPVDIKYEAVRSSSKIRQIIKAVCDFDFKLYFQCPDPKTGLGAFEWSMFHSSFLPLASGFAPETENAFYLFDKDLPSDEEIKAITDPSDKIVEFVVDYDNINSQKINAL